jgi:hypothetical protein
MRAADRRHQKFHSQNRLSFRLPFNLSEKQDDSRESTPSPLRPHYSSECPRVFAFLFTSSWRAFPAPTASDLAASPIFPRLTHSHSWFWVSPSELHQADLTRPTTFFSWVKSRILFRQYSPRCRWIEVQSHLVVLLSVMVGWIFPDSLPP